MSDSIALREQLVRRGLWLTWATFAYNSLEAVLSLLASVLSGSVALFGFGVDSGIELGASAVALWRLYSDGDPVRREQSERVALRLIGAGFLALAAYVAGESAHMLWTREAPAESPLGIGVAAAAVVVMPLLARAKTRVARAMASGALEAEATQTMLCTYLSAILLVGLLLNAAFGWWWADPVAALCMTPIIGREGWEAIRGRPACEC